jgi:pyridine nucleotide-disulfide oxidoreductase family protein
VAAGSMGRHHVLLVGAGHSHVEVLKIWASRPVPDTRLTVVSDSARAVYTGMVPGYVAGQYALAELEIDVERLARRARARWIETRATALEAGARTLHGEGVAPISYDTVSFDVGSTVAGLDVPGVEKHALPTRPIREFAHRVESLLERVRQRPSLRLVVVGAGAGGIELACAFRARLSRLGLREASVTLLERGPRILPGYPRSAAARLKRHARAHGIAIRCGMAVARAEADHLVLENGESMPCDVLVWVTGAASVLLFDRAGLERDERGFVKVRETLQAVGHDEIFASGDCASLLTDPRLPKAGVFAVREGPILASNLMARITGARLRTYRPQRDFLSLLNLGDGRAVAVKWGLSAEGRWVWRLKDAIDRRFVRRYQ